ncbi:MAG: glutamate 5-kinase [Pseudomonadota bacterium]|nr:glutamate 5-kinase [Pseudomonadota bacterium]
MNRNINNLKKIVIKIGSSLISEDKLLSEKRILNWAKQISGLRKEGKEIVIVTSGSISQGQNLLNMDKRPDNLETLQALAAIGQQQLMGIYEDSFQKSNILTAQVLLTHQDMIDRERYLNAKATIQKIINLDAIPIINENDVVATEEIRFGDNDTLAAMVCNLIDADLLIILTDQDGLFDKDPKSNKDVKLIKECNVDEISISDIEFKSKSTFGTGGFKTKLNAVKIASSSGTTSIIASGNSNQVIEKIMGNNEIGTIFHPSQKPLTAKKQWLANYSNSDGSIILDDGAIKAINSSGTSLLAVGITKVNNKFNRGEIISCLNSDAIIVAKGITNYSSEEIDLIKGLASDKIKSTLGYISNDEIIHRDNLVIL